MLVMFGKVLRLASKCCNRLVSKTVAYVPNVPAQCVTSPADVTMAMVKSMASLRQMHRDGKHIRKLKCKKLGPLDGNPFLKGVVLKTMVKKPKKPNSANRKCVRVKMSTGKEATAYIPGEGHNLQEHSIVLVRGGRVQDLPGVKLKCVRGKYDLAHVQKK